MSTVVITPEMQRQNAEALVGQDPGKFRDPGHRWSMKRYAEISRMLKQTEVEKPVTVLNLNPFFLEINGGVYFSGERIEACPADKPYTVHVIGQTRWGHKDLGADQQNTMQMEPVPAIPLVLASEYIREYMQQDGGFGGVLCYLGDHDPATIKKGEKVRVPEIAYDKHGEFYVELHDRDFHEILARVKLKRNRSLMLRLESANSWYEVESQRLNVNDTHREMARMAEREGLIKELPRWVMQASTLNAEQPPACPICRSIPNAGAIMCVNCNYIIDVVETYRLRPSECAYGSAEMDRLTPEQWKVVNQIKADRDRARGVKKVDGQ